MRTNLKVNRQLKKSTRVKFQEGWADHPPLFGFSIQISDIRGQNPYLIYTYSKIGATPLIEKWVCGNSGKIIPYISDIVQKKTDFKPSLRQTRVVPLILIRVLPLKKPSKMGLFPQKPF